MPSRSSANVSLTGERIWASPFTEKWWVPRFQSVVLLSTRKWYSYSTSITLLKMKKRATDKAATAAMTGIRRIGVSCYTADLIPLPLISIVRHRPFSPPFSMPRLSTATNIQKNGATHIEIASKRFYHYWSQRNLFWNSMKIF